MSTALLQTVASLEETIKQDETVGPVVKEIERSMFFTDVPDCGAMKFTPSCGEDAVSPEVQDDVSRSVLTFCGSLERAFCFSDLQDIPAEDIERLRSMKSLQEDNDEEKTGDEIVKEATGAPAEQPVADTDTESMSDDSADANKEATTAVGEEDPKPEDSAAVQAVKAAVIAATTGAVAKTVAEDVLPPKNAFQSSTNKTKSGKPLNAMQAAKLAKKAEKEAKKKLAGSSKKKGWGLFRKSATKTATAAV